MKKMTRFGFASLVLAAAVGLGAGGCSHDKTSDSGSMAMNSTCACGHAASSAYTEMHDGKKIAFCSQACENKFNSASHADQHKMMDRMR
jgi:hypothetical protein